MAKPLTLKQLADSICDKIIERFENEDSASTPDGVYRKQRALQRLRLWFESVSVIPLGELERAAVAGEKVRVAYDERDYLPADLKIIKEYRNSAAIHPLVESHDRRRTNVNLKKLFIRSPKQKDLFADFYEEERTKALILGDDNRSPISIASPEHYKLNDDVDDANWEAQEKAREQQLTVRRARTRQFARTGAINTDDNMRKLGLWPKKSK